MTRREYPEKVYLNLRVGARDDNRKYNTIDQNLPDCFAKASS